jgi:hypothetical protein
MSTASNPDPTSARKRRRTEEPTGWKAIPMGVKVLFGVCLLAVIIVPLVTRNKRSDKLDVVSSPVAANVEGLTIKEAGLDPGSRRVKGLLENGSDKVMRDVQVSYDVRTGFQGMGIIVAKVPSVAPHQTARFETDPMPAGGKEFLLREVTAAAQ